MEEATFRPRPPARLLVGALLALAILVSAAPARAQSAADQYIPSADPGRVTDPTAGGDAGDAVPEAGDAVPEAAGSADGAATPKSPAETAIQQGESRGGSAPGSDYPITPWVALVLGLAAAAVLARVAISVARRRTRSVHSG